MYFCVLVGVLYPDSISSMHRKLENHSDIQGPRTFDMSASYRWELESSRNFSAKSSISVLGTPL